VEVKVLKLAVKRQTKPKIVPNPGKCLLSSIIDDYTKLIPAAACVREYNEGKNKGFGLLHPQFNLPVQSYCRDRTEPGYRAIPLPKELQALAEERGYRVVEEGADFQVRASRAKGQRVRFELSYIPQDRVVWSKKASELKEEVIESEENKIISQRIDELETRIEESHSPKEIISSKAELAVIRQQYSEESNEYIPGKSAYIAAFEKLKRCE
jgi:hypothetical protein